MKILYLSDLDGTLLRPNERLSEYTMTIINRFIQNGGCFSYATARSIVTASKVTVGLNRRFPAICNGGAFIIENTTNEILLSNYFSPDEVETASDIFRIHEIYPFVHTYIDGKERFSYIERYVTSAMQHYLNNRIGDPRRRVVEGVDELYHGHVFNFACMDTDAILSPIARIFASDDRFSCIYQKEIYSGDQWCEILPVNATKANAALQLKSMLGCDRMVVFGDGRNDLSLFSVANESYAMANAVPELKEIATAVIDSNDQDGVAKWMEKRAF